MRNKGSTVPAIRAWLAGAAAGHPEPPPDGIPADALLDAARAEGVDGLVARAVLERGPAAGTALEPWAERRRELIADELARGRELRELVRDFDTARLPVILLKGAALAYTHYPEPWTRPRTDTDLWCTDDDLPRVRDLLRARGYEPSLQTEGGGQFQFQWHRVAGGATHHVDVHVRLLNLAILADALDHAEALDRAVRVPALGGALVLCPADALLHACLHRAAHHNDSDVLVWAFDVHLLAGTLDGDGWSRVVRLAGRSATRALCRAGLAVAADAFGTAVPADVAAALEGGADEPSAALLGGELSELDLQWINLRHQRGWGARIALARRHVLPPVGYMRRRYGYPRGYLRLPALYVWRIVAGLPGWLRRPKTRRTG